MTDADLAELERLASSASARTAKRPTHRLGQLALRLLTAWKERAVRHDQALLDIKREMHVNKMTMTAKLAELDRLLWSAALMWLGASDTLSEVRRHAEGIGKNRDYAFGRLNEIGRTLDPTVADGVNLSPDAVLRWARDAAAKLGRVEKLPDNWETQTVLSQAEHEHRFQCARELREALADPPAESPS